MLCYNFHNMLICLVTVAKYAAIETFRSVVTVTVVCTSNSWFTEVMVTHQFSFKLKGGQDICTDKIPIYAFKH